jgi:hypothetical protein
MKFIDIIVKTRVAVSDEHNAPGCARSIEEALRAQIWEWAKHPERMILETELSFSEQQP